MISIISLLLSLVVTVSVAQAADMETPGQALGRLAIQDSGRVKPFDTFARESLQLIYGRTNYNGKAPNEVVFTWLMIPDHWMKTKFVQVNYAGLKQALKLDKTVEYLSPQELLANDRLPLLFQDLQTKLEHKEKLNGYYQAVQRLENQLGLFQSIQNGTALRLAPQTGTTTWLSVDKFDGKLKDAFVNLTQEFVKSISAAAKTGKAEPSVAMKQAADQFIALARAQNPSEYPTVSRLSTEIHYNHLNPFQWAWICYLLGAIFLVMLMVSGRSWTNYAAWVFLLAGFGIHAYGIGLRVYLAGRPPVTNMYETVIWVPWGAMFFALILERFQKNKMLLLGASCIATLCLLLSSMAPTVLDGSIEPLQPVLRSNYWLATHVLIISISYAAFFLAFALGDLLLFYYARGEKKFKKEIEQGVRSVYRAIQIGVVLLALGIILGGIWADYSWGRFWGWDPKETWALIALLGYIAILHGRLAGWLRSYGMAVSSVIAFSLVIMAWYGVNYVLGAGLHTYGFGAGGFSYVLGFVIVHLLYVVYVTTVRYARLKEKS